MIFIPLDRYLFGIIFGGLILLILGIFDDKYNLNPYLRLLVQLFAAAIPVIFGIGVAFINNPLGGVIDLTNPQATFNILGQVRNIWLISAAFSLFWIIFMMNILNMGAKGVDGQLPGVVGIASIVVGILSLKYSADIAEWPIITLAFIVSGSYFGFLPFNFYPQKIMPGFSGGTLAGYFLAILAILSTAKVGTLLVCLGIPIIDTGYTILRRISQGKSPVWGDAGHLHHRLLNAGFNKKQVAYFYWIFTAFLGFIALYLKAEHKLYTIIGLVLLLGGLIIWLTYRPKNKIN
jgi:UDP-GlcNAc:undecaprenyl-phosphate GlcNAc-1-phosphate transferase